MLTSHKVKFHGSVQAEEAFQQLKECFISAPILSLPDPALQFITEVDASDSGVGAVLSIACIQNHKSSRCETKTPQVNENTSHLSRQPE